MLMNKGEYQAFIAAREAVTIVRQGHSVFSQVSLGEILSTNNKDAFRSINSKRVDLLITLDNRPLKLRIRSIVDARNSITRFLKSSVKRTIRFLGDTTGQLLCSFRPL
ncbi:DUF2726 domain-containing protein [Phytohalomonas tamaricis]|uniref:DUF2726 domain-containing protein n=1 Tax=Phytohalomonas tamaricis TaxID=2081032 RepID=UPI000D0B1106